MAIELSDVQTVEAILCWHANVQTQIAEAIKTLSAKLGVSEDDVLGVLNEQLTLRQTLDRFGVEVICAELREDECDEEC